MSAGNTIVCDQVVFTSIRTPTGQGYRIIAASPGVRAAEKSEITARSPSHGSLSESQSDAAGLLTYQLSSGRRCVGFVCHAGTEQSGRGGERVYTHMAMLDQAAYRAFDSDPVRVHSAIGDCVRASGPMLKPPPHIGPLTLTPAVTDATPPTQALNRVGATASHLMAGHMLILVGEGSSIALLQRVLMSMPRSFRERVNASSEIRFSPSRGMHLVMLGTADPQLTYQLAGQDISISAMSTPPTAVPTHLEAWFRLIERWSREGRFAEIRHLTSEICADAPVESLARVAAICQDMDSLDTGDLGVVEVMSQRYSTSGRTPAEAALLEELRCKIQNRREQLAEPVNTV